MRRLARQIGHMEKPAAQPRPPCRGEVHQTVEQMVAHKAMMGPAFRTDIVFN